MKITGKHTSNLGLLLAILMLTSCGGGGGSGGDGDSGTPGNFSLTDNWVGQFTSANGAFTFSGPLMQFGDIVSGQLFTSNGFDLALNGTINGSTINFTLDGSAPGCVGNYVGSGLVQENGTFDTITFSFTGSDCGGPISANGFMDSVTEAPPTIFDVTGSWTGTYSLPGQPGAVPIQGTLTQDGVNVSGALIAGNGSILSFSGTVLNDTSIAINGQSGGNGCSGSFSGTATLEATGPTSAQIGFVFDGFDSCAGSYNGATAFIARN
jgi:hypothetical protein